MQRLRFFGWWLAGGVLLLFLIVSGTLAPAASIPDMSLSDKLQHFAGYLLLALWFAGLVGHYRYPALGLGLIALGCGLEVAQALMAVGRSADWWDISANLLGVAAGLGLARAGLGSWMLAVERGLGGR